MIEALKKRGHQMVAAENKLSFGRAEMILIMENGVYIGACESRTDGSVASY